MPARIPAVVGVLAVALSLLAAALLPGVAAADVTVAASRAEAGARDVTVAFRVTNADPAVPTTRLQVFLPPVRPLQGVVPTAPAGWTARVDTAAGGVPTAVTWEGGSLGGAGYAVFPLDVARLPDGAGPLRFRVVVTVATGATEEWSDLLPFGAPVPAHPALVVRYTTAGTPVALADPPAGHHHHGAGDVAVGARTGTAGRTVAIAGLVAVLVAVLVDGLARRQRRRMTAVLRRDRR